MRPEAPDVTLAGARILEWDSEFFSRRIARIEPFALLANSGKAVDEWCRRERVDCVYLLADEEDQLATDAALGFTLVDHRVTLDVPVSPPPAGTSGSNVAIRVVAPADVEALKAIARESHRDTRFYADGHFDRRRCDDLYEVWIAKSCNGWADRVFVAELPEGVAGYLTCHLRGDEGQIGLVGIAAASRGHGSGRALVAEAWRWFASQRVDRISVVTQGRNKPGLRLYQGAGFAVRSIQHWYHKWF